MRLPGGGPETAAVSLTICRNLPHDAAVFHEPTWPFTTPIYVTHVSLDSERIVVRHVRALVLRRFLLGLALEKGAHGLSCGDFSFHRRARITRTTMPSRRGSPPRPRRSRSWPPTASA